LCSHNLMPRPTSRLCFVRRPGTGDHESLAKQRGGFLRPQLTRSEGGLLAICARSAVRRRAGRNSAQRSPFSFRLSAVEEDAVRSFRIILLVLMLVIAAALAAGAWLIAEQPQPRTAEGWSLGPPLAAPRGELATAVGYARPCPAPPCADNERLFVLGGLSGFFNPESRVEVFNPTRNTWSVGPPLPDARHHFSPSHLRDPPPL